MTRIFDDVRKVERRKRETLRKKRKGREKPGTNQRKKKVWRYKTWGKRKKNEREREKESGGGKYVGGVEVGRDKNGFNIDFRGLFVGKINLSPC